MATLIYTKAAFKNFYGSGTSQQRAHLSWTCHGSSWKTRKIFPGVKSTAENTTGPTLKPFICILLHKEICYHKVITRHLAINMKSIQDNMMAAMLRKKKGVLELNKRVTDTHVQKENDGNGRLRAPSWTRLRVRERLQMPSESLSARDVCFLVWPGPKVTEEGSSASDASSPLGCLLCYNLI